MRGEVGRYPPIESHAIIGDLQTAALVTLDGTIDFLCLPHFDSPSVFASLLDADKGGCFSITPELEQPRYKQLYLPNTNLLLTRFLAPEGVVEISDFMPVHPREHTSRVVRRVKTVRGEIGYRIRCAPRFDYARATHRAESTDRGETSLVLEGEQDIRRLPGGMLLIADREGLQFLIRDLGTLDKGSRRFLDRFL